MYFELDLWTSDVLFFYFYQVHISLFYFYSLFKLHAIKNLENISHITSEDKDSFLLRKHKFHFLCAFLKKKKLLLDICNR